MRQYSSLAPYFLIPQSLLRYERGYVGFTLMPGRIRSTASEPNNIGARKIVGWYYSSPKVNVVDRVTAQSRAYGNKWLDTLLKHIRLVVNSSLDFNA